MIFLVLGAVAVLSLFMTGFLLPETLAERDRVPVNLANLWRGAKGLLVDPTFVGLTMLGGFGMASFFVFIASAAFVYTQEFGLSSVQFSLAFAVNALGFFASSQFAAPLGERLGPRQVVAAAAAGFGVATLVLLAVVLAGYGSLTVVIAGLFMANVCLGLVIPTTMVMALDDHGDVAGLASSLGGTLQMLVGGAMIAAAGPFFDGTALPMIAAIAVCGVVAFALSRFVLARQRTSAAHLVAARPQN